MDVKLWREATIDDANPQQMWVVPVERCEHVDEDHPYGHIDPHWEYTGVPNIQTGDSMEWCPGAVIGGDDAD